MTVDDASVAASRARSAARALVLPTVAIVLVAINLRPSLASVGPVLPQIEAGGQLTHAAAGVLVALPVLAFGLLAPFPAILIRWATEETLVLVALIILMLSLVLRSAGGLPALFAGTAVIGASIAVINVLLPAIVKARFPDHVGLVTGTYTACLSLGASLGAGLTLPLAHRAGLGWRGALLIWVVPAIAACGVWLARGRRSVPHGQAVPVVQVRLFPTAAWRSGHAWGVTLFVGMQSLEYYSILAWLPSILASHGVSVATSGWLLAVFNWAGIPASLAVPYLCRPRAMVRPMAMGCGVAWAIGLAGLLTGQGVVAATILLGLAQGAAISLGLSLVALKSAGGAHTVALSGMAQALGYVLGSIGPVAVGAIFSVTASWTAALTCLLCAAGALLAAGFAASVDTTDGRAKIGSAGR